MCDAALSLQLALPGAQRSRGLGTHPRAQGWPCTGLGRGGRSLPGRAGQQCQGFVTRAASPCLAACTGAPGREARSGTSSRSLLDGDTGSPRGHGMRRAAPSRAPCPGSHLPLHAPPELEARQRLGQLLPLPKGLGFLFGVLGRSSHRAPAWPRAMPGAAGRGGGRPCHGYSHKQPGSSADIYIQYLYIYIPGADRPPAPPLLQGCCARDGGFIRHAVYTAAGGARGAEPGGFGVRGTKHHP